MQNLTVSLVQCELAWEDPESNRRQIESWVEGTQHPTDLIVLPEMFTTGFSMEAVKNAEGPGGATEAWMRQLANQYQCAIAGSIAVREDNSVFNRLLFVTPNKTWHYDKRHLFRMAGEHKHYSSGQQRVIAQWRGWRINLQVCYDLRFPVFSRNRDDYDLLLYVANWPAKRSAHWRQLLIARAIENQTCVVGVNRVGDDANGINYSGDSLAITEDGTLSSDMKNDRAVVQIEFDMARLRRYRDKFPCHLDADAFQLTGD